MSDSEDDNIGIKPKKSPLTSAEKTVLLSLIRAKKDVVESKKTDFGTIGKKNRAWDEISEQFCSQPNCSRRNAKQIRTWWDNLKKRNKKEVTKHKREVRRTGGGQKPPDLPPETEEVMAIVPSQMISLDNEFDCDEVNNEMFDQPSIPEARGDVPEIADHSSENVSDPAGDLSVVEKSIKGNRRDRRLCSCSRIHGCHEQIHTNEQQYFGS